MYYWVLGYTPFNQTLISKGPFMREGAALTVMKCWRPDIELFIFASRYNKLADMVNEYQSHILKKKAANAYRSAHRPSRAQGNRPYMAKQWAF